MKVSSTILLTLPLTCIAAVLQPPPTPAPGTGQAVYANAQEAFHDLLDALPEESLQAALSQLKGWKHGVFENHHRGVEQVHHSNPALATKLIVAAVQDLKKRQAPANSSSVPLPPPSSARPISTTPPPSLPSSSQAPPPPPSSSQAIPPPPSSSNPLVVIPAPRTTVESGRTVVQISNVLSSPTAFVTVAATLTNSAGQTITTTETKPAIIITLTNSAGNTITTTSPVPTLGEALTTTDARGSTLVTVFTPGGGKISTVRLITTTGADGKPSIITSYAFVDPTATSTNKPGLQNGAVQNGTPLVLTLAGIASGALAVFL